MTKNAAAKPPIDPHVDAPCGALRGRRVRGADAYLGVPYAEPPIGPRRFRPPAPLRPWPGVRDARGHAASSPQVSGFPPWFKRWLGIASGVEAEDCLYLNVWTPRSDAGRRPVMVWLHGGGFTAGSGSSFLYEGHRLARRGDVVVVTANYRLGVLGFLNASGIDGTDDITPNAGLLDQVAGLEWVQRNIEAFGGDPQRVTVFGESAGAMSVATLLAMPSARGLFHRAILQSGAAAHVASPQTARQVASTLLDRLKAGGGSGSPADRLRDAPVDALLRAQRETSAAIRLPLGQLVWQPSIDGDALAEPPLARIAEGAAHGIPLLIGSNRDEWKLFTLGDRKRRRLDAQTLHDYVTRTFEQEPGADARTAERALALYSRSSDGGPVRTPADQWVAMQSDRVFRHPASELAAAQASHAPVYQYRFDWSPAPIRGLLGACHAVEIPFVFGSMRAPRLLPMAVEPTAHRIASQMQDAWLAFARADEGGPGHRALPDWPALDVERRATMLFDTEPRCVDDPEAPERRFWDALRAQASGAERDGDGPIGEG